VYECIPNRGGKAHFILSDGMGSGGAAAVEAGMAASLLARLITVGFSHESALMMVNSALLIKSGEESLATIDVCTLDLYTGRASFYKAGAAPSFVIRNGRAGCIESASLPAGILQGVAFDKSSITLAAGDSIVLVSDGVTATGADWLRSELESIHGGDMQRLAEKIALTAKLRRTDAREDDITVVAVGLHSC
jgi:stage II sporulation protein E